MGAATPSLVLAGDSPMVFSKEDKPGNFVFEKDSAGLGVPRGSLGSLNKISHQVEQHGSASIQVYAAAPSGWTGTSSHGASAGPVTVRAGSPIQGANSSFASESRSSSYGGSSVAQATSSSHGGTASASTSGSGSSGSGGNRGGSSPK
jgi:hypothetical protein